MSGSIWQYNTNTLEISQDNGVEELVYEEDLLKALETKTANYTASLRLIAGGEKQKEFLLKQQYDVLKEISFIQSHQQRQFIANILALIQLFDKAVLSEENKKMLELLETCAGQADRSIKETVNKINKWCETISKNISD